MCSCRDCAWQGTATEKIMHIHIACRVLTNAIIRSKLEPKRQNSAGNIRYYAVFRDLSPGPSGSAQHAPGCCARMLSVLKDLNAVDEDVPDAHGVSVGSFVRGDVFDRIGVEYNDVRKVSRT